MRIFFVKSSTMILSITLFVLFMLVTANRLPIIQTMQRISSETREYWKGSTDIIWRINTRDRMIALTFDDGPSPTFTPQILDILKRNKVKATFFVIAKEVEKYPNIIHRAVYEGNEIGNHTYNHRYLKRTTGDK